MSGSCGIARLILIKWLIRAFETTCNLANEPRSDNMESINFGATRPGSHPLPPRCNNNKHSPPVLDVHPSTTPPTCRPKPTLRYLPTRIISTPTYSILLTRTTVSTMISSTTTYSCAADSLDSLFSLFVDERAVLADESPCFGGSFQSSSSYSSASSSDESEVRSKSPVHAFHSALHHSPTYRQPSPPLQQYQQQYSSLPQLSAGSGKGRPRKLAGGPENVAVVKRRERNRLAAERCRQKKILTISALQEQCDILRQERDFLLQQLAHFQRQQSPLNSSGPQLL
jgi:hypothetical protein